MPDNDPGGSSQRTAADKRRLSAAYATIEKTLSESPRGRWFLDEYTRRCRGTDTQRLLEAVAKLEVTMLRAQRHEGAQHDVLAELLEMREAIARTRREVAALTLPDQRESQLVGATVELDQIVEVTETATSDILQAAEEIQETAWMLRERGGDAGLCDTLDRRATDIYTACSFQDITGQRTDKVVKLLYFVEQRIDAMIEIWGGDGARAESQPSHAPQQASGVEPADDRPRDDDALRQAEVDAMFGTEAAASSGPAESEASEPAADHPPEEPGGTAESQIFEAPEPLQLGSLPAVKRSALFG